MEYRNIYANCYNRKNKTNLRGHIYVDEFADFEMAKNIVLNAKTSRPSVCNAAEKLLVHEKIAKEFMPIILKALRDKIDEMLKKMDSSKI